MDGTAGQKTTWPRKLLALFTFRRVRDTKSKAPPETPPKAISASVIVSAENALRGIPIHGAKLGIGASLDVIKKIGLTPALNQETVWSLERNVATSRRTPGTLGLHGETSIPCGC
ncbi:hypothetical protein BS47DRAFT_1391750 [Hydnum rufescens UP504]|uniref:Uncharacterized protein n=1 Tax=Hydnum rufescens UP504 TaxID=1448309 RepID=A0A9P6DXT8_9AGAM|nr:hypothetical protein BS47DRAFT_1391750 [Hydnum rufescens UP504]